ncbi:MULTISPECIES: hypothetical protein [Spiroplasma]|uniref:MYM-type domain-containing protein n=1 Tax=Spiroplasma ixodetis TaxID=2141 RepID=A0ABN6T1E4_9MOLU|nr:MULTISPECIES: hypothetical protein [Spiroplasma]BDT04406.1 hypothetical protein SHM_20520 [Spiroplasma ixodetis]BDT05220.1 hypothetical protein SHM_28660 [Spiroplasma ixodetis]
MAIITTKCYLASCEKEYKFDFLYRDKFIYCSGKCYQKSFDNTVTKFAQK